MSRQHHSYGIAIYGRNSHFKKIHLNELLIGQEKEYLLHRFQQEGEPLYIDFSHCYLCLTGVKKRVYTGVYGLDANDYMGVYARVEQDLKYFLPDAGYQFEMVPFYYSDKQIVLIFSPIKENPLDAALVADHLENLVQRLYEEHIFHGDRRYCNFTVLSPRLSSYEELAPCFQEMRRLHELSFFLMEPVVMTRERLECLSNHRTYEEVFEVLKEAENSVGLESEGQLEERLRELFLEHLKYSFSFPLCRDVLSELKNQLHRQSRVYDLELPIPPDSFFEPKSHASIEALYEAVSGCLRELSAQVRGYGRPLSYLTQEAVRFLRNNFRREITLTDTAGYVNVAPGYLSRIFNRETGSSLPAFLSRLRIDEAKRLMRETNLKVWEIALQVGIPDANHFGRVFKKLEGMTPQQYKQKLSGEAPS